MRRTVWLLPALLFAASARADAPTEARTVLDRAVKAMGGADKLGKLDAVSWKSKGKVTAQTITADFQDEGSLAGIDRMQWTIDATIMTRALNLIAVVDGGKGWLIVQNQAQATEMPKELNAVLRKDLRVIRLAQQLTPLLDKRYALSPLGELKIDDRPAVGIKIIEKGQPDIDLFFDKETALPLRGEVRLKESDTSDEVTHAFYFQDYKAFDGVKHFTKIALKRDDKTFLEMEITEVKREAKLDDSVFAKP